MGGRGGKRLLCVKLGRGVSAVALWFVHIKYCINTYLYYDSSLFSLTFSQPELFVFGVRCPETSGL